jgi:hypothetical protein
MFLKALRLHFSVQLDLVRVFFRHACSDTIQATVYRALSEIAQVFALFIPLKILIIMGSKEIPLYFQGYISDETRSFWLLFLTAVTFFIYLFSIFFGMLSHRMVASGFLRFSLLHDCINHQDSTKRQGLRRVYKLALNGYSNVLIILAGLLFALLLNPIVTVVTFIFIILQIMIVNNLIAKDSGVAGWLGHAIKKEPTEYLNYFAAINFLLVFTLLLVDYLLAGYINTIGAILMLLLSRRTFQALKQYGVIAIKLNEETESVTCLLKHDSTQ